MREYETVIARVEALARDLGLSFDPVVFRLTDSEEIAEVASMGLPNRFVHWYWGGAYKEIHAQQSKAVFSILELVLNTRPSYAFLRRTNTYLQNLCVIAHVYGHADFFANNHWFRKSNKGILNLAEQHARTFRSFEEQYGRETVERLLDACLTVATSVNAFERDPARRMRRVIYYLEARAPLQDHERYILEAVRQEAEYFDLIQRTHIINEGWATFVELELLRELVSARQWAEVSSSICSRPTTYMIGYTLFQYIRRSWGWQKALEVRRFYEDVRLIDEMLTQELVHRLDLFVYDPRDRTKNTEVGAVKEMLIQQKLYKGDPPIEVEDPTGPRDLTLVHVEEGKKLDPKRIALYLRSVYTLWRNPVRLRANGKVYTYDRRGLSTS
ncbi:MAG: SpoVR family protein [Armatimonadetes bacterium]|nr:SpoVR family protein [Armatimonadota bacterium]MDW8154085.1 SpoVR family protein [Armatimonadota bacterium]